MQELIRRRLLGDEVKWTTMGQSFGGFCTLTYLSIAPHGLEASLITGGLSPVMPGCSADAVYTRLFRRVRTQVPDSKSLPNSVCTMVTSRL